MAAKRTVRLGQDDCGGTAYFLDRRTSDSFSRPLAHLLLVDNEDEDEVGCSLRFGDRELLLLLLATENGVYGRGCGLYGARADSCSKR